MVKLLLPVLLAAIGTGAGVGAGLMLMPAAEDSAEAAPGCAPAEAAPEPAPAPAAAPPESPADSEYVKLNNQFIVPVMGREALRALVVASLSVEVAAGRSEAVYAREPKLRDVLLQVLFDHANIGGFEGAFTSGERMKILRGALLEAARGVLGSDVSDVLITEIARQDA
jgi:hypothetical protein